jgi:hypothetical protein
MPFRSEEVAAPVGSRSSPEPAHSFLQRGKTRRAIPERVTEMAPVEAMLALCKCKEDESWLS